MVAPRYSTAVQAGLDGDARNHLGFMLHKLCQPGVHLRLSKYSSGQLDVAPEVPRFRRKQPLYSFASCGSCRSALPQTAFAHSFSASMIAQVKGLSNNPMQLLLSHRFMQSRRVPTCGQPPSRNPLARQPLNHFFVMRQFTPALRQRRLEFRPFPHTETSDRTPLTPLSFRSARGRAKSRKMRHRIRQPSPASSVVLGEACAAGYRRIGGAMPARAKAMLRWRKAMVIRRRAPESMNAAAVSFCDLPVCQRWLLFFRHPRQRRLSAVCCRCVHETVVSSGSTTDMPVDLAAPPAGRSVSAARHCQCRKTCPPNRTWAARSMAAA